MISRRMVLAGMYTLSPACDASMTQVPTAPRVTAPPALTEHVDDPDTTVYVTARPLVAVAPRANTGSPYDLVATAGKVMLWFNRPATMVCVTVSEANQFESPGCCAEISQVPEATIVTTPLLWSKVHTAPSPAVIQ